MRIGVLTGGGDVPGLNAAIRAVVLRAHQLGHTTAAVHDGWKGLLGQGMVEDLPPERVADLLPIGGTVIGSSRTNPAKDEASMAEVQENLRRHGLEALVAMGGDDTQSVSLKLSQAGVRVVGVPKTMDNDLGATEYCIGFDTAVTVVMEALDRLRTTADSHHRVLVLEVMGRDAGWVAVVGGLTGGADFIIVPEVAVAVEEVCRHVLRRYEQGPRYSLIVVSEGANLEGIKAEDTGERDAFGHPILMKRAVGDRLADAIKEQTGKECRATVLGHVQRGGSPTAYDRFWAARVGYAAVDLLHQGRDGVLAAVQGGQVVPVPLEQAVARTRTIDPELYELARTFFI
jgi:6-phosphofructokinase 1